MDPRRADISQWVAHLRDLPNERLSERTRTSVQMRRNEPKGFYRNKDVESNSEETELEAINPQMEEAKRIYESEFWASTNFAWLFSEVVPDWLDTDPADWPDVRRILQGFKHRDFIRQISSANEDVEKRQTELNYSDSETETDSSYDCPAVIIVSTKDSKHTLKSCFNVPEDGSFRAYKLKMVIMGSIDVELFSLDEDEIDWKRIPVNLERFEVNGWYIRDISLQEMQVRKLRKARQGLYRDIDQGDTLTATKSRSHLCDLYNQKLRSQMAEYQDSNDSACKRRDEGSGPTRIQSRIISPHKSAKHLVRSVMMRNVNRPSLQSSSSSSNDAGHKGKSLSHFPGDSHNGGEISSESMSAVNSKLSRGDSKNVTRYYTKGEYNAGQTASMNAIGATKDNAINIFFAEALPIVSSQTDLCNLPQNVKSENLSTENIEDDFSKLLVSASKHSITSGKRQKKQQFKDDNRVRPSISSQSLDDLLNEALKEEEALEKRRAEKISSKAESEKNLDDSSVSTYSPSKTVIQENQPTPQFNTLNDSASETELFRGTSQLITCPQHYGTLRISDELDPMKDNTDSNTSIRLLGLKKNTLELQTDSIKEDKTEELVKKHSHYNKIRLNEHSERPKSRRGCDQPRTPLVVAKCIEPRHRPRHYNVDSHLQGRTDVTVDRPLRGSSSNESLSSNISMENCVSLRQSLRSPNDSNTTYTIDVGTTSSTRSHSNISTCDNGQISENVLLHPIHQRRKRFFNFLQSNLSCLRRKLQSINCCSKSNN